MVINTNSNRNSPKNLHPFSIGGLWFKAGIPTSNSIVTDVTHKEITSPRTIPYPMLVRARAAINASMNFASFSTSSPSSHSGRHDAGGAAEVADSSIAFSIRNVKMSSCRRKGVFPARKSRAASRSHAEVLPRPRDQGQPAWLRTRDCHPLPPARARPGAGRGAGGQDAPSGRGAAPSAVGIHPGIFGAQALMRMAEPRRVIPPGGGHQVANAWWSGVSLATAVR